VCIAGSGGAGGAQRAQAPAQVAHRRLHLGCAHANEVLDAFVKMRHQRQRTPHPAT
jgi:hypothetical protein